MPVPINKEITIKLLDSAKTLSRAKAVEKVALWIHFYTMSSVLKGTSEEGTANTITEEFMVLLMEAINQAEIISQKAT